MFISATIYEFPHYWHELDWQPMVLFGVFILVGLALVVYFLSNL